MISNHLDSTSMASFVKAVFFFFKLSFDIWVLAVFEGVFFVSQILKVNFLYLVPELIFPNSHFFAVIIDQKHIFIRGLMVLN